MGVSQCVSVVTVLVGTGFRCMTCGLLDAALMTAEVVLVGAGLVVSARLVDLVTWCLTLVEAVGVGTLRAPVSAMVSGFILWVSLCMSVELGMCRVMALPLCRQLGEMVLSV